MKVKSVSASVRFSGAVGPSKFKTVELSAEATVLGDEDWQSAQIELYQDLGKQVKILWLQGQKPSEGSERLLQAPVDSNPSETPVAEHFCQEHQTAFKKYHRGDNTWYSHKAGTGKWCKETQPL